MTQMQMLVSVRDAADAAAAIAGGADIIDAKDPDGGALAPLPSETLRAVVAEVRAARPVSAAIGDVAACKPESIARSVDGLGLSFVKVGVSDLSDIADATRRATALGRALAATDGPGLVLATFADLRSQPTGGPFGVIRIAERAGVAGVLLDTAHKVGRTLFDYIAPETVARWVARAHHAGLLVALAGSLGLDDLQLVQSLGADIVGVRGSACHGGRRGRVSAERVGELLRRRDVSGDAGGERALEVAVH